MERRRKHQDCIGVCFVVEGTKCESAVMRSVRATWDSKSSREEEDVLDLWYELGVFCVVACFVFDTVVLIKLF